MGIGRATLRMLAEEGARRPFHGTIATLGKMSINVTSAEISRIFSQKISGPIDDNQVFRLFGFTSTESIDYSDFEGANHILDLNDPIPPDLRERFDVVLDSGTLEHVFHLPNALRNAVSLAKVGGRIIISAPSSNYMDHGFYMFSPTLFMDYFKANDLQVETFYIIRHSVDSAAPWKVYDYRAGDQAKLFVGCLDRGAYGIFAIVTRTEQSTIDRIPQQSYYEDVWGEVPVRPPRWMEFARSILRLVPGGVASAIRLRAVLKRRGLSGLRYVGRY